MIILTNHKFNLMISNNAIAQKSNRKTPKIVDLFDCPLTSEHYETYFLSNHNTNHYIGTRNL